MSRYKQSDLLSVCMAQWHIPTVSFLSFNTELSYKKRSARFEFSKLALSRDLSLTSQLPIEEIHSIRIESLL
jgi:hypothetical protein